MMKLLVVLQFF